MFSLHIDKFFHNSPGVPDAGALLILPESDKSPVSSDCSIHQKQRPGIYSSQNRNRLFSALDAVPGGLTAVVGMFYLTDLRYIIRGPD